MIDEPPLPDAAEPLVELPDGPMTYDQIMSLKTEAPYLKPCIVQAILADASLAEMEDLNIAYASLGSLGSLG